MLCVATHPDAQNNHYYGVAIGIVVIAGAVCVGPVSGGAFNPAVAIGLSIADDFSKITYALEVAACNLISALIANICFLIVHPPIKSEASKDKSIV